MKRISGIAGLIDYPFTSHKSLPMDLYIVARSRFIIGCDAGFSTGFAVAFGTPTLITNDTSPIATSFWPYENSRVLLQYTVESATGRILNLPERSDPRLSTVFNTVAFQDMGYHWEPNTAEEILESTVEMMDLVEKDSFDSPLTEEQEYSHRCRKDALSSMRPLGGPYGDTKWSQMQEPQSRISESFAARCFREEARSIPDKNPTLVS